MWGDTAQGATTGGKKKKKGWLISYPTTSRILLEHLSRGADMPAVCKPISPLLVWKPTYSSLQAILVIGDGVGGAQGGSDRYRSPREVHSRRRREEGDVRDRGGQRESEMQERINGGEPVMGMDTRTGR